MTKQTLQTWLMAVVMLATAVAHVYPTALPAGFEAALRDGFATSKQLDALAQDVKRLEQALATLNARIALLPPWPPGASAAAADLTPPPNPPIKGAPRPRGLAY